MRELRRASTPFLHVCFSVCVPFTQLCDCLSHLRRSMCYTKRCSVTTL